MCFWDKFIEKNGQKVGDFNIIFSKVKHIFELTTLFPTFLCPIRFIKLASKLNFKNWKCLILCRKLFASVMDKRIFFYQVCNMKLKPTFGLKNTGKHWQLVFVCPPIYEIIGFWLVLQQYFFNQLFFWRGMYIWIPSLTQPLSINFSNFYFAIDHDFWT